MKTEHFDELAHFFGWWMQQSHGGVPTSVHDGIARVGDYTGLILYRQPPFQVELWIIPPNTESPAHSHPDVDIFLVHVCGEIKVWVGEELVLGPAQTVPDKNGVTKSNGNFVRLPPGQVHRAGTGPMGGAFINVQHWLDGKPRFTSDNWEGGALNEEHKKKLEERLNRQEYVRSLRETSESSRLEAMLISRRARGTQASPADSTRRLSDDFGGGPSEPVTERSGDSSTVNAQNPSGRLEPSVIPGSTTTL